MLGLVSTRVVMPKRCAMSATARVPDSWASRTATVLIDKAKAWRSETGPASRRYCCAGSSPPIVIGASWTILSGR